MRGVGCPQTAGRYPPNEVSREAGAMRGASRSGAGLTIGRRGDLNNLNRNTPRRVNVATYKLAIRAAR